MNVSIGISFLNNERTLDAAIQSVLAQTHLDWELILVDDGSTDRSCEIARSYQNDRIRLLWDGRNRGLGARLNQIARSARGELVARMDADDVMHPRRLEIQHECFVSHPDVDVVGSAIYSIDSRYRVRGIRECNGVAGRVTGRRALRQGLLAHVSVMARRDWFLRYPYDEYWQRLQDRELWCRTYDQSRFHHIREPLLFVLEADDAGYVQRYLRSCSYERRLLLRHGPHLAGWAETGWLFAKSWLKTVIHRVGDLVGARQLLIDRRNQRVPVEQLPEAQRILDEILAADLPAYQSGVARAA